MLLCPFITQMSPMRMSSISIVASPACTFSVCPVALAGCASNVTSHRPLSPAALPVADLSPSVTFTSLPAGAQPQTLIGLSRCSTMWLRKIPFTFNASAASSDDTLAISRQTISPIGLNLISIRIPCVDWRPSRLAVRPQTLGPPTGDIRQNLCGSSHARIRAPHPRRVSRATQRPIMQPTGTLTPTGPHDMTRSLRVTLFACLFVLTSLAHVATAANDRPNVILIMADDQGYGDLSLTGNTIIDTPNMDRLAKEGAWFKHFYVSPVCTPTRAHLMTGRYNYRTRAIDTYLGRAVMDPAEVTVAQVMSNAGYATGIFGKWHLGDNYPTRATDKGFAESLVICGGGLRQPANPPWGERYHDPILFHNGKPQRYEGYCTNIFFDEATEYIAQQAKAHKPFFVYLPTNAPHGPFDEPPTRELWEHFLGKFPDDKNTNRAGFYAMIKNIDENIGRLLARLKQLDIDDNTLIIFLSDNGPSAGSAGPFRGHKGSAYEGGIRNVCFVRWPGVILPGTSSDVTTAHLDIMPTILDFCRVPKPEGLKLDGRSLRPLIAEKGPQKSVLWPDRYLFFQWHRGDVPQRYHHFAAVDPKGRWKLVTDSNPGRDSIPGEPKFELYDLNNDIGEKNNLAAQHPDIVEKLKKEYDAWFDDVCHTREPNFGMPPIVIGAEQQPTVVLTPQDKRVDTDDKGGWWAGGGWPVDVRRTGPYTFNILLTDDTDKDTAVHLTVEVAGKTLTKTLTIPRGVNSMPIGDVTLPATGPGRVTAQVADATPKGPHVYQVTIK
ncbi:MAG: sulfatase-like hydrolase/transferase [Phycisphaera sp.]|nr:sulfatase-like hydrolase/transferase [Phycisphaera sp.]